MEEKNTTKISLSTFLLILAIIVILGMGVFIYKLNNDKSLEIQKSTELQTKINSLNDTVTDLQGKTNSISETVEKQSTTPETNKSEIVKEKNNNTIKELTSSEILKSIYSNNNGNFTMKFSYITITSRFNNNESEVEVVVNENKFGDVTGKVKLLNHTSEGNVKLHEKIVDVLFDVNTEGSISTITLLTSNGKAYTTPWDYRYDSSQAELFEMGDNIVKLSYDNKGGCGYNKNGKVVFHTEDIYNDGE